jgi:2-amino-4-hydroxy-6-hydroxymethyldihydropteridine diphosphokinase
MSIFYLGLGSNQGDRKANLDNALKALGACGAVGSASSIYETEPKYDSDQPKFLNMVCELDSELVAIELFEAVKTIEQELGRVPTHKNGPRVIDIDLLFSADEEYSDEVLQVPHPKFSERAFVLVPFAEMAPLVFIPQLSSTVQELLSKLDKSLIAEVQAIKASKQ